MSEWINGVCDQVDRLAAQDPYYQELDAARLKLEPRYLALLDSLSEADRSIIIEYAYLTTELAYQKTQAAYHFGQQCRNP